MTHSIDDQVYHSGRGKSRQSYCHHCKCSLSSQSKDRWKQHMRACLDCPVDIKRVFVVRGKRVKRRGVFPVVASTLPAAPSSWHRVHTASHDGPTELPFVTTATEFEVPEFRVADFCLDTSARPATSSRAPTTQTSMEKWADSMDAAWQEHCDSLFSAIFYETAIPFTVADSTAVRKFLTAVRPSYTPPSSKVISGRILDATAESHAAQTLATVQAHSHMCLVTDGWSNVAGDHLVNMVIVFPNGKQRPLLWKTISTEETAQTAENVAAAIQDVLNEIGVDKIVAVVTDNAANMRAAWKLLEAANPGLVCNGCAAHGFNLLVKDVCQLAAHAELLEKCRAITAFVRQRTAVLTRFRRIQRNAMAEGELFVMRNLTYIVDTRWYTHHTCVQRVLQNKYVLATLANNPLLSRLQGRSAARAREFTAVVQDAAFWVDLRKLETTLEPTTKWIKILEADTGRASHVYRAFVEMKAAWRGDRTLQRLIKERWAFLHTDAMGVAYLLDPTSKGGADMVGNDQLDALLEVKKLAVLKGYTVEEGTVAAELDDYFLLFNGSQPMVMQLIEAQSSNTFWQTYGRKHFPVLSKVATLVNTIPTSQAAAERVWSVYNFVHTKRRNRLSHEKTTKLVQLYVNAKTAAKERDIINVMQAVDSDAEIEQ